MSARSPDEVALLCGEVRRAIIGGALMVLFGIACVGGAFVRFIIWPAMNG